MTPPERLLSHLVQRERVQTLRQHIHGSVSKRTTLLALVSVVCVLAVVSGAALSQSGTPPTAETNNSTVAPGAQVASAVSVEGAALESDVQRRTLDVELARATSDEERAAIIATTIRTLDGRLDALETRYQQLRDARRAGTMSDATYHVEKSTIVAEAAMIERTVDGLQTAATKLPASRFEAQYSNTTTIERLDERARALANGAVITTSETSSETPTPTATPMPTETPTPEPTATDGSTPTDQPAGNTGADGDNGTDTDDGNDDDDAGESDDDSDGTDDSDDDADDEAGDTGDDG